MINVADVKAPNGKTYRENNLAQGHAIAVGSLVEIVYEDDDYHENPRNGLRLYVVNHSRDCDGTPLYSMSFNINAQVDYDAVEADKENLRQQGLFGYLNGIRSGAILHGFSEESLRLIREPR